MRRGRWAGNILTSSDPGRTRPPGASPRSCQGSRSGGVSCPTVSLCVAYTRATSRPPLIRLAARARGRRPKSIRGLCRPRLVPVGFAVRGGGVRNVDGDAPTVLTSDRSGAAARAPGAACRVGARPGLAVSCPSVSLCVVGTSGGDVVTSIDPTGRREGLGRRPRSIRAFLSAVSCPSVSLCVAADAVGKILISTNPTGGPTLGQSPSRTRGQLDGVPCPSVSLCVGGDGSATS